MIEKLKQIHETFRLIHSAYVAEMTTEEETLFRRALEELYDLIEKNSATLEKLHQIHTTLGLIRAGHGEKMAQGEVFADALEKLFDVMEEYPASQAPGSEWPSDLDEIWKALK
jgi:hypothetical protein